jgi:small-conductance mechanosensitive channel
MMRTWKLIRFTALVAALLAAAPIVAQDPPVKNTDKPDEVQKQLKDLKTSVDGPQGLKKSVEEINDKLKSLDKIHTALNNLHVDLNTRSQAADREIANLKDEVARLRTEVDSLRKTPTSASRESGFAPGATTAPLASGRVELLNTWTAPVAVVVNNRTYRLLPMERRLTDPIPAGTFTYEVINVTAPNIARSLAANQVYTIHIHPLP